MENRRDKSTAGEPKRCFDHTVDPVFRDACRSTGVNCRFDSGNVE